jgi:hypothetical protein
MPVVLKITGKASIWSMALVACFVFCAFGGRVTATVFPREVTMRIEPLKAAVREGEDIGIMVVFVGGTHETTLTLPAGADASGMITYRVIEVASGREWAAAERDPRSFAADSRQRISAGGRIERLHALQFESPDGPFVANLPAGTYRIIGTYDEGKALRPENRTSRVLRSQPAEIVVTAP